MVYIALDDEQMEVIYASRSFPLPIQQSTNTIIIRNLFNSQCIRNEDKEYQQAAPQRKITTKPNESLLTHKSNPQLYKTHLGIQTITKLGNPTRNLIKRD